MLGMSFALGGSVVLLRHREERGVLQHVAREHELLHGRRGLLEERRERGERGDRHLRGDGRDRRSDLGRRMGPGRKVDDRPFEGSDLRRGRPRFAESLDAHLEGS